VSANPSVGSQWVGTLAGTNAGTVSNVFASGQIDGGAVTGVVAGGLVGANGSPGLGPGAITLSGADVALGSAGINVSLGGLVGSNSPGSTITASYATGNVTSTAGADQNGAGFAGGLAGQNFGSIADSAAWGNVSVGVNGTGGGLVGFNSGVIENAFALGNVSGAPGTGGVNSPGASTTLGGLAGVNQGTDHRFIRSRDRRQSRCHQSQGRRAGRRQ
jgi:hypothetical protein